MADWLAIKTEYVTGGLSLQALATKYGVAFSTIRKRSASEHWVEHREEHRNNVGTLVEQKAVEKISEAESDIAAIEARTRLKIWEEIERRIGEASEEMEGTDFRRLVQNYCDMLGIESGGKNKWEPANDDDPITKALKARYGKNI